MRNVVSLWLAVDQRRRLTQHSSSTDSVNEHGIDPVTEWTDADPSALNEKLLHGAESQGLVQGRSIVCHRQETVASFIPTLDSDLLLVTKVAVP